MFLCNLTDCTNIRNLHHGIGRRLHIDQFRVFLNGFFHRSQICRIHISKLHAVFFIDQTKLSDHTAVKIIGRYYMIPRFEKFHKSADRCHSAGKSNGIHSMLQICHNALQFFSCGILHSVIIVSGTLTNARMRICRRLINRKTDCSRSLYIFPMSLSMNTYCVQFVAHFHILHTCLIINIITQNPYSVDFLFILYCL